MRKSHKTIRIPEWIQNEAEEWIVNDKNVKNFSQLVEHSLKVYLLHNDPVTKMLYKIKQQIEYSISYLEKIRDNPMEHFSDKMEASLLALHETLAELKKCPHFMDMKLPPDFPE